MRAHAGLPVGLALAGVLLGGLAVAVGDTGAFAQANVPFPTPEFMERRYKIEAVRFKALDETGADWLGSDEVMVGTVDAKGETVSDEFGSVDSGETRGFAPAASCVVAVRPGEAVLDRTSVCDGDGEPAPLSFEVEFWEKDNISFPPGFCGLAQPPPPRHYRSHCLNDQTGDDFIGYLQLDFATQELEAALPNVGDVRVETVKLSHCEKDTICGASSFPEYTFTYRVTRLADVSVGLRDVLDEAMSRIGARSELEVVVAGLRSLRAPSPREIEAETAVSLP